MGPCSSIPAWKILWTEEPGELRSTGVANRRTRLSTHTHLLASTSESMEAKNLISSDSLLCVVMQTY